MEKKEFDFRNSENSPVGAMVLVALVFALFLALSIARQVEHREAQRTADSVAAGWKAP